MANSKIGGGDQHLQIQPRELPGPSLETPNEVSPADRLQIALSEIPEKSPILEAKLSAPEALLSSGLAMLTDKHYSPSAKNTALNVMVQAMGASAGGASEADVDAAVAQLKGGVSKLLRSMVTVTAQTLQAIKEDAPRLVQLAVVALGNDGLGKDKTGQLVADLDKVQSALSDLLAMPAAERSEFITKLTSDLSWVRGVFDRGNAALQAADINGSARLDALTGIFQIISKYANAAE